jgi:isoleucyl-tRNA synthetase
MDGLLNYELRRAHLAIFDFCNDTLSAIYCVAVKDHLYCDQPDSPRRRRTQATLTRLAEMLCRVTAPILAHTADEAWRSLKGEDACVHLEQIQPIEVSADAAWPEVMAAREGILKALEEARSTDFGGQGGLEKSLDAGVVVPDEHGTLTPFADTLATLCEVSRLRCDPAATEIQVEDLRSAPRCERSWRRDESVAQRDNGAWLSDRDWAAVQAAG